MHTGCHIHAIGTLVAYLSVQTLFLRSLPCGAQRAPELATWGVDLPATTEALFAVVKRHDDAAMEIDDTPGNPQDASASKGTGSAGDGEQGAERHVVEITLGTVRRMRVFLTLCAR
jgi:hypothetical protein